MPTITQADLLRKAAGPITTGDFTADIGTLQPEQASAFMDLVYDGTPMAGLQRSERRKSKKGSIAKIGIGGRLLRKKTQGVDDATLAKPSYGDVQYSCDASRLEWEIDEEVFQENIEQEGYEDHVARLMASQVGRDLEDLHFNGDTADTSADAAFLTQNDGWLKQIAAGGSGAHRVNGATLNGGYISKDHFFAAQQALPSKYWVLQGLRWLGAPLLQSVYVEYLTNRATVGGDAALSGQGAASAPLGIPFQPIPAMPANRLLLAVPNNFIVVNTLDIRFRRTVEGREAIREDKRFYAIFLNDDPIVDTMDAVADVYGVVAAIHP
jgi:hypothetical protein